MNDTKGAPPATSEEGPAQKVTPQQERTLKMLGLWEATRAGLQARLEDDDAGELTASFFGATVRFLEASGISALTVIEAKDALEQLKMAELVVSIEQATEDAVDAASPAPPGAEPEASTEGTPLSAPFTPRPPR